MTPLVGKIIDGGHAQHVLSSSQIARLLGGSDQRRYGQVNRSLRSGDLIKIKRGLYRLADRYLAAPMHPFVLAQQIIPGSYVSCESALSFHGWIPEAVHNVVSIKNTVKSVTYEQQTVGKFEFMHVPTQPAFFLQCVMRHKLSNQISLIAEPIRALIDLVYLRKWSWDGLDFLLQGLRIDEVALRAVSAEQFDKLLAIYKGNREQRYIKRLRQVLSK